MSVEEALELISDACMEAAGGDNAACRGVRPVEERVSTRGKGLPSHRHSPHHGKNCHPGQSSPNMRISAKGRQFDREFLLHKRQVMDNLASNACDHSPKGGVDRKCLPLMHILNTHSDYVTTSSCSGRIALFHSVSVPQTRDGCVAAPAPTVKRGDKDALGWLMVKHGVLTKREIDDLVRCLCGDTDDGNAPNETSSSAVTEAAERPDELDGVWVRDGVLGAASLPSFGMVALKMEPFVMHVECRTMASAKLLLSAAVADAGFRNSGVTPPGKKIMCAIRHASGLGLDVPLVVDGVNYAAGQHAYVRRLLGLANEKMRGNDMRLQRLEAGLADRLQRQNDNET